MKTLVFAALGLLLLTFLFVWCVGRVYYQITSRHVKVMLFGLCLRQVSLNQIEAVSKRRSNGLAENWWSTLSPGHRSLIIRRRRGILKNFVITPRNRYVFKSELEHALERSRAATEPQPAELIFSE